MPAQAPSPAQSPLAAARMPASAHAQFPRQSAALPLSSTAVTAAVNPGRPALCIPTFASKNEPGVRVPVYIDSITRMDVLLRAQWIVDFLPSVTTWILTLGFHQQISTSVTIIIKWEQVQTSWMRVNSWLKLFGSSSYRARIWRMYLYWASYRLRSSAGNEPLPKHNFDLFPK